MNNNDLILLWCKQYIDKLLAEPQGSNGNYVSFDELTEEQIAMLKGDPGPSGKDGYTPIKGIDYFDGKDGAAGIPGQNGADGVGIASIKQTTTSTADDGNNIFTVTLTNGTSATFTVQNGSKGSAGADGKTPYQVALDKGYAGTEAAFNSALVALPYHNARHLPSGADPIVMETGNIKDAAVTRAKLASSAKSLNFANKTIATSAWASNSTYSGYPYRASVACSGVTANHFPVVVFSPSDASGGNFAPVAVSYSGGVYIYAASKPTATVTIPNIACLPMA